MIQFDSVSKTYKDGTSAVVDLDLVIPSGQVTVIVGPSGCGKTTTLRMINRMLEPTKGVITWDGEPLRSKRRTTLRRHMGYVIQSGGLFPHRTVLENIGTVPGLLGWNRSKARTRALQLLDDVGLDRKLAHRYPGQLSGGQQQRVGVARALAADPLVLLMDEPFSAVDPVLRDELHELMQRLQSELEKTVVMITHDIDEAIKLGDQVAVMQVGGKLAQLGTPQDLLDNPVDDFVAGFVGRDRGYRALSFAGAADLPLSRIRAVRDPSSHTGDDLALVVDAAAVPVGWADASRPGQVLGLGSVFDPDRDTLRIALDAALTSPAGLAVAVSRETGRYLGVVSTAEILSRVRDSRTAVAHAAVDSAAPESVSFEPVETTGGDEGDVDGLDQRGEPESTVVERGDTTAGDEDDGDEPDQEGVELDQRSEGESSVEPAETTADEAPDSTVVESVESAGGVDPGEGGR